MRLIDADELKNAFREDGHLSGYIEEFIDDCPTIEAEPVKHGRWFGGYQQENGEWFYEKPYCSVCGAKHSGKTPFCGNCGAKMDGGAE